jgi:uncharacterized protein YqjF (DUF2071 family)
MHPALLCTDHRPWPLPPSRWTWRQNWYDLLFAHWPIAVSTVRHLVPPALTIQEFGGTSWIGVVPFRMTGVMRRPFPDLPWISAFPELNVRLYVEHDGKPGVWFLSLDATNPLAVWAARRFFCLPYYRSRIAFENVAGTIRFRAERRDSDVRFDAEYRAISEPFTAARGSIEEFLAERYCLYAADGNGRLYRADVHHLPWPLQRAEGTMNAGSLLASHGISVAREPLLHFSKGVDTIVWPLTNLVGSTEGSH